MLITWHASTWKRHRGWRSTGTYFVRETNGVGVTFEARFKCCWLHISPGLYGLIIVFVCYVISNDSTFFPFILVFHILVNSSSGGWGRRGSAWPQNGHPVCGRVIWTWSCVPYIICSMKGSWLRAIRCLVCKLLPSTFSHSGSSHVESEDICFWSRLYLERQDPN